MKRYKELLTYIKSAVVRNYSERSINSILDYISTSKQVLKIIFKQKSNLNHSLSFKDGFATEFLRDNIISP